MANVVSDSRQSRARDDRVEVPPVTMTGIRKVYGATVANDSVQFELAPGEIHALLGENGAGKTTLMSILFGFVRPDDGEIFLGDEQVQFASPHDAFQRGIGMVHQHFMLVPKFTVAENVVLGSVSPWNPSLRRAEVERSVAAAAERFGIGVHPRQRVGDLPIDTQQRVEILKVLYRGARILILDEPTSLLGPAQVAGLFATLRDLKAAGHSIVVVTHKLSEVMEIADRVTVLRHGRNVSTVDRGSFDERTVARAMTGHDLEELPPRSAVARDRHVPRVQVRDLVVVGDRQRRLVDGVSLEVYGGEILGVAGVEGNGQRELVDVLAGVTTAASGELLVEGRDLSGAAPRDLHAAGMSVIPEDRHGWGLVLDMTLAENIALAAVPVGRFSRWGLVNARAMRAHARRLLEEYDVRPPDPDLRALELSGGNQQKVVLARELSREPNVLVAANPTHGLDVGAAEYVRRRLLEARQRGSAIVLVSHDLDELLELSDRVVVLFRGRILYQAPVGEISMDELALAMAGTAPRAHAEAAEAAR